MLISTLLRRISAEERMLVDLLGAEYCSYSTKTEPAATPPTERAGPKPKRLLKLTEAAEYLNLSKATLYKMTMTRRIPFYKVGSRTMFSEEQLGTWIKKLRMSPKDSLRERDRSKSSNHKYTVLWNNVWEDSLVHPFKLYKLQTIFVLVVGENLPIWLCGLRVHYESSQTLADR